MHTRLTNSPSRIEGIDVLRGLAALTVVLSHYFPYWDRYLGAVPVLVPGKFGFYAVELFFIISGVVIFNTLEKCRSVTHFAYLRFSRLYPAYWFCLLFVVLAYWLVFDEPIYRNGVIINATMLQEFLGFGNFDNVYWSLTVELAFYFNVAWLFALGWHRRVFTLCACWLVAAIVLQLVLGSFTNDDRNWLSLLFVFDYAHFFVIGIALYDAARNGASRSTFGLMALALVAAVVNAGLEGLVVTATVLLLSALAMFGQLNFLVNRATLWLGNISFSLYLIHRNLGYQLLPIMQEAGWGPWLSIATTTAFVLVLASLVTYAVERPVLALLRRFRVGVRPN